MRKHLRARRRPGIRRTAAFAAAIAALLAAGGCLSAGDATYRNLFPAYAEVKARPAGSILVRIFKEESELEVWRLGADGRYALAATHPLCRWSGRLGPKKTAGDRQAPEGFYRVAAAQMNPNSRFHRSFNLNYPNPLERSLGYRGDSLMVHGACSSAGCFAMSDAGIGAIYDEALTAFALGQSDFQVQSFPFRMTAAQMARHRADANIGFWRNLKQGYDIFEVTRREPDVSACGGRYVFDARRADGRPIEAAAACPPLETRLAPEVAARQAEDAATLQALVAQGRAGTPTRYVDGGMHASFRERLARLGPKALASETSATAVPISRPEALAGDPAAPEG